MTTAHPCGRLPVYGLALSAWYCHHHQAWWCTAMTYIQRSDDLPQRQEFDSIEFGPFDTNVEVMDWIVAHLDVPASPPA